MKYFLMSSLFYQVPLPQAPGTVAFSVSLQNGDSLPLAVSELLEMQQSARVLCDYKGGKVRFFTPRPRRPLLYLPRPAEEWLDRKRRSAAELNSMPLVTFFKLLGDAKNDNAVLEACVKLQMLVARLLRYIHAARTAASSLGVNGFPLWLFEKASVRYCYDDYKRHHNSQVELLMSRLDRVRRELNCFDASYLQIFPAPSPRLAALRFWFWAAHGLRFRNAILFHLEDAARVASRFCSPGVSLYSPVFVTDLDKDDDIWEVSTSAEG